MRFPQSKLGGWLGLALLLALGVNLAVGAWRYGHECRRSGRFLLDTKLRAAAQMMRCLEQGYVRPDALDPERQLNQGLRGMASGLDRFTSYSISYERDVQDSIRGQFVGIGVQLELTGGHWQVSTALPGAPAERSGVRSGDWIEAVDGVRVTAEDRLPQLLKGANRPGTGLQLGLFRPSENRRFQVPLVREIIAFSPVYRKRRLPDGILYIRLSQFNDPCAAELQAFLEAEKQKAQGLILDLRGNPGGTVFAAEEVASMFLPNGSLLFETAGRGGEWHRRRTGAARYAFGQPVAILVDESTASAAEIVAACLRDHGRAVLVGSTTFGKASVQIPVPLADGGVLRMTSEVWRTPLGFNILGRGLKPDLEAKTPPGEEGALLLAWLEADRSPGLPVPDSDAALAAARGLLADPGRLATVLAASRTSATAVGDEKKW